MVDSIHVEKKLICRSMKRFKYAVTLKWSWKKLSVLSTRGRHGHTEMEWVTLFTNETE